MIVTFCHWERIKERQCMLCLKNLEAWDLALDDLQEDVVGVVRDGLAHGGSL
jgi:hypothetical protein